MEWFFFRSVIRLVAFKFKIFLVYYGPVRCLDCVAANKVKGFEQIRRFEQVEDHDQIAQTNYTWDHLMETSMRFDLLV